MSIVIPVLDEAAIIGHTLRPLQPLRGSEIEIIVVDGGSSDRTPDIARPLADRVLESRPGRALQMNCGWQAARAPMVWFLHADTTVNAGHVNALLSLSSARPLWGFFALQLSSRRRIFRILEAAITARSKISRLATGDQGIFVSRCLLEQMQGYPELALMEDLALCKRLRKTTNPRLLEPPLVTSSRRWEKRGVVRTVITMWCLRAAWTLGVPAARLATLYRRVR